MSEPAGTVQCAACGRVANCIRVADGTVYRPFTWQAQSDGSLLCLDCSGVVPPWQQEPTNV